MIKRKRRKVFKPFIFLRTIFMLGAVAALVFVTPLFCIKDVEIKGNSKVSYDALLSASDIFIGDNIFRTNLGASRQKLEAMPFVDSAVIKRVFPSSITIEISESETAGYIPFFSSYIGIDQNGKILETLNEGDIRKKPTFLNVWAKDFKVGEKIKVDEMKKFDIIVLYLNVLGQSGLLDSVTSVDLQNLEDVSITIWDKLLVKIGNEQELLYKIKYMKTVLAEIGEHSPGELDLRNTGRASYRVT